jgi:hypothetical protein
MTMRLAALLAMFLHHHARCIGTWDVVASVPSETRVAMQPIIEKIKRLKEFQQQCLHGRPATGGRMFDPDQFEVVGDVQGLRILLLDDTFTTGAKLFSAVSALRRAGGVVVGPVVLGRHVQPGWPPSVAMLKWLDDHAWDETRCCRCGGARREEGSLL